MAGAVVMIAIFFAIMTFLEFQNFEKSMSKFHAELPTSVWPNTSATASFREQMQRSVAQASFELERDLIARRYEQTGLAISARMWTRFMGFTTGMLMALLGSAFVLGRLEDSGAELAGEGASAGQKVSLTFKSASPGLILAALGSALMALSIIVPTKAETEDRPTYFGLPPGESLNATPILRDPAPAARNTDDLLNVAPP